MRMASTGCSKSRRLNRSWQPSLFAVYRTTASPSELGWCNRKRYRLCFLMLIKVDSHQLCNLTIVCLVWSTGRSITRLWRNRSMEDFGSEIFAIKTVLCAGNVVYQAVDKVLQQHSRCTQRLKVWRRVRFAYLLTADLLEGLSGQRTTDATRVCDCPGAHGSAVR
jgi:hypothetical protein